MRTEGPSTGGFPKPAAAQRVLIAERRVKVLELRRAGYTLREIGAELGVSHRTALTDEQAAIKAMLVQPAEDVRKLELERLERLWKIAFAVADDEKATPEQRLRAVDSCLRVAQRRAAMEGIDEPEKFDLGPWVEELARAQGLDASLALETAREVVRSLGF